MSKLPFLSRHQQIVTPSAGVRLVFRLQVLLMAGFPIVSAAAQQSPVQVEVSATAIPVWTRVNPIPGGGELEEIRVVQPMLTVQAIAWRRLSLRITGDLEGETIPDGELAPGAFGEGYMDRRHPHTYLHELMLTGDDLLGGWDGDARISLSLGKGFVAFGTDDPMSRPPLRYPVNHHFSQILERAVGILGIAVGPTLVEASIFNGDEPEKPSQSPRLGRFGDSWALRLTFLPVKGFEFQGSIANVHSPEHRGGVGLDQSKVSLSARWSGAVVRVPVYLLAEWAESSEADRFFVFNSYLIEGQAAPGRHRAYARLERTKRPEEMRTANPFRTVRPHLDNSLVGITQWSVQTVGYGFTLGPVIGRLRLEPFGEVSHASVTRIGGGLFRPELFYGDTDFWALSGGLRITWGMVGHRMGRYGAAVPPSHAMEH